MEKNYSEPTETTYEFDRRFYGIHVADAIDRIKNGVATGDDAEILRRKLDSYREKLARLEGLMR
jgi:hypothetical protein